MSFDKISIDWDKEGYKEFEDLFIEELQQMKVYILQAIFWIIDKPQDRLHVVEIELKDENIEIALNEKFDSVFSYFVESYFEPDRTLNLTLMERDYHKLDTSIIGYIQIPPLDTWTKEKRDDLRSKIINFLREHTDARNL